MNKPLPSKNIPPQPSLDSNERWANTRHDGLQNPRRDLICQIRRLVTMTKRDKYKEAELGWSPQLNFRVTPTEGMRFPEQRLGTKCHNFCDWLKIQTVQFFTSFGPFLPPHQAFRKWLAWREIAWQRMWCRSFSNFDNNLQMITSHSSLISSTLTL